MKITGAEFKAFYHDKAYWPDGRHHDDTSIYVDGKDFDEIDDASTIPDAASVVINDCGAVYEDDGTELCSMTTHFRRWRKARTSTTFIVTVDKDKADAVRAAIKSAGGRVS